VNIVRSYFTQDAINLLQEVARQATSISVRSRQKNGVTILVVKGSLDAVSAVHSHRRMEFEEEVGMTIESLDKLILTAGYRYEAKWSAQRNLYSWNDLTIDMFFTPGYGFMVEFEKVITDSDAIEPTRQYIFDIMSELGIQEIEADRLERMFAYYNAHWQEYYGTKKVFTLK